MFVIYYLIAMCIFAGVNACLLSCFYRRPLNSYFTAFFFSIVLADFGQLFLALSTTIEGAVVANKVCYLGSCFLPLFLFLLVCRLCSFKVANWVKLLLFMYSTLVFALSCTVGFSDIFYESVRYVVLNGFGMRNLPDAKGGLQESCRVLSPGGYLMVLEFFSPRQAFNRFFYKCLAPLFIPFLGAIFSGKRDAYEYLVYSILRFLPVKDFCNLATENGFEVVSVKPCFFGVAYRVLLKKKVLA